MVESGWRWLEVVESGWKWLEVVGGGWRWLRAALSRLNYGMPFLTMKLPSVIEEKI